ncbi:hypothetical protein LOD99_6210 [Oopsacas minuta]|uniref:Uncharacterized protein n=1 Tax=Oopsacas minuta TaxID=111878 RepID=A0AAV7JMI8_9METZ|nr:hypothetical protein LOD99_6210 [Oopsacas minuta]
MNFERDNILDRPPHASPEKKTELAFDDIVSSDRDESPISKDIPKNIELEFWYSDHSSQTDESLSDILPPSTPRAYFLLTPDTRDKKCHKQSELDEK